MNSALLAHAVVTMLLQTGTQDVVACPGSRNTPLLLALERAEHAGLLRLHIRIDERGAAFVALGIAKATGSPAAVVTTSGTAVGNLLPAVMEAHHAGIALLVITADRPAILRGTGANQTTNQPDIFGTFTRSCIELSSAEPDAWAAGLDQVLACAHNPNNPGPVQLNLELDEPLVSEPLGFSAPPSRPPVTVCEPASLALTATPDLVLLLGDATPSVGRHYAELGLAASIPVLAEPSSNGRIPGTIQCYDLLLESSLAAEINRVIVVGRPTLSRPQRRLLSDPRFDVIQVGATSAPERFPATRIRTDAITLTPLADQSWLTRWQAEDRLAAEKVAALATSNALNGWGLVACVLEHMTTSDNLMWGSSRLVRDAAESPISPTPARCYANRGLAGIDGLMSTAMGLALGSRRPTTLVLGDLSTLHDLNALALPTAEFVPDLRIVIGNDDGGAIFSTLEQSTLSQTIFERLFGVPHAITLSTISRALGFSSRQVKTQAELINALAGPISGIEIIEVALDRSNRNEHVTALRRLDVI